MKEKWKWIRGYKGRYKVSTLGRVKSVDRTTPHWQGGVIRIKGKVLKPVPDADGYLKVTLSWGQTKDRRISCLVAETFIPNPKNKPYVNHIDTDKTNNKVTNLEWTTPFENSNHARINGLLRKGDGRQKVSWMKIKKLRKMYSTRLYTIREVAQEFSLTQGHTAEIIRRKVRVCR